MGDVFTVFALIHFGPGPGLVTYWANVLATAIASYLKRYGWHFAEHVIAHRLLFNLAACSLSIYLMFLTYKSTLTTLNSERLGTAVALMAVASVWFIVNTGTLSVAVSLSSSASLLSVWQKGLSLYLLNFFGSCAAAGILSILYVQTDLSVFLLSIPLAAVLYQLHSYYVQKDLQAQKHIEDLNTVYLQTVESLAAAVDAKDRYTHGHIRRVQSYATELASIMGITDHSEMMAIRAGALLHDIGKIAIPEYILNKPSALTESEYSKMKLHPLIGSNMLKNVNFPFPVLPMVRSHHERWDGNGYPDRLRGEQIPIGARILSLVDCYDALTTDRPYRTPMQRDELIGFFQRESAKSYDPAVVDALITNLDRIEAVGEIANAAAVDVWGINESKPEETRTSRPLEKVQPIVTYGKALSEDATLQSQLFSAFEFARANIQCLTAEDVFVFMGRKLERLVSFDAAVFYLANLEKGTIVAEYVLGNAADGLKLLTLPLEKKLSGWVASTNQGLCNLPPFPDFMGSIDPIPAFEISAIAPMNKNGTVFGAISLYRKQRQRFQDEEFRRLEILASQTALALSNCEPTRKAGALLDTVTGLPNGYHLHLMFEQLIFDAKKFDYDFALLSFSLDTTRVRRRWGYAFGEEVIQMTASFLRKEFRETDLLVRYASDQFLAIVPRIDRPYAESLQERLTDGLLGVQVGVRNGMTIGLPISAGVAMFPEDGGELETLLGVSTWRSRGDQKFRHQHPKAVT